MTKKVTQFAIGMLLLGLLVQVVIIAPRQIRNSMKTPTTTGAAGESAASGPASDGVDQSMNGMHMIETLEGAREWELWSDRALSFKSRERLELTGVKAIFFSTNGVTFTVTGKKGVVQVKSKNLRVEGDVVTQSSNGYRFETAAVEYDSSARRLTARQAIKMQGPPDTEGHRLKLTGLSMKASLKASEIEIERDVRAEKTLPGERVAYVRSQRALFSGLDRTAQFAGEVILDMDATRITGPRAKFAYDSEGRTIKSVLFTGGARVSDADKFASARDVQVDFKENRFVFRGEPRVVQNSDELRGEEIIFLDGGKRVQVTGARAKVDEKRVGGSKQGITP